MDLTAIIACKNRTKNLKYCLASINRCKPRPETIVVDFGSDDDLQTIITYPWLSIIRVNSDTGTFHKARALNIGIRAAKTKFMCITDADQIFAKNFFGAVQQPLHKNPNALVMCHTHFLKTIPAGVSPSNIGEKYATLLTSLKGSKTHGDGCCNGIRLSWVKYARGYDERYIGYGAEDSDFALRAQVAGFTRVWIHNRTSMIHLPHPKTGAYYAKNVFKRNRKMFFTLRKAPIVRANPKKPWGKR